MLEIEASVRIIFNKAFWTRTNLPLMELGKICQCSEEDDSHSFPPERFKICRGGNRRAESSPTPHGPVFQAEMNYVSFCSLINILPKKCMSTTVELISRGSSETIWKVSIWPCHCAFGQHCPSHRVFRCTAVGLLQILQLWPCLGLIRCKSSPSNWGKEAAPPSVVGAYPQREL